MFNHGSQLPRLMSQLPLFPISQRCLISPSGSEVQSLMNSPPKRLKRDHSLIDDSIPTPPPMSPTFEGAEGFYPFLSYSNPQPMNENLEESNSSWLYSADVQHSQARLDANDQLVPQPPCPHCRQILPQGYFFQHSSLITAQQLVQKISEFKKEMSEAVTLFDQDSPIPQPIQRSESLSSLDYFPSSAEARLHRPETVSETNLLASWMSPTTSFAAADLPPVHARTISLSSLVAESQSIRASVGNESPQLDLPPQARDCGSLATRPEELNARPESCPWQQLACISPRPERLASLLSSQGLVHVKKNVLRDTVSLPKGHRIIKAVGLAFPFTGISVYDALADMDNMNKLYQTEFSLKVTPPPTKSGTWCLKMSSEDSTQIFRDFSTEMPVQVVFGILISARPEHSVWELHPLEPLCTVTHIRYTPQALFGYSHFVRKSQTDADMIQFVTSEILKQKSPNQKCSRILGEHDISFFRRCLVDSYSKSRDIQLIHLMESKKFDKLNGSNEWMSKIVETWAQDEVHRLWEQNVISGFLLDEVVAQILWNAPDSSYFVHFNEDKSNPNSLIVSVRKSGCIARILIQMGQQKKKSKTDSAVSTFTLHASQLGLQFPRHHFAETDSLEEAILMARQH